MVEIFHGSLGENPKGRLEKKKEKTKTKRVGATLVKTRKGAKVGFLNRQAQEGTAGDLVHLGFSSYL